MSVRVSVGVQVGTDACTWLYMCVRKSMTTLGVGHCSSPSTVNFLGFVCLFVVCLFVLEIGSLH